MSPDMNNQTAQLTGARQTMMSWSKVIESYEAVPEAYKSIFASNSNTGRAFPFTVLAPSLDRSTHNTSEKIIYEFDNAIHIAENKGGRISTQGYPLASIRDVEMGNILLKSWMTISGVTGAGTMSSSTIDFSASTEERCFTPFLNKIRPVPVGDDEPWKKVEQKKFDYLAPLNFKFMNFGRSCLIQGEKVIRIILQPEIREQSWSLLGYKFYRTVSPAHVIILTDKELILIYDDERTEANKGVRYGGVWRYIPLHNIASMSLTELPNDLMTLSITLSPEGEIKKIFQVSSKQELEQLQEELERVIKQ
jgi:hypothetical protein